MKKFYVLTVFTMSLFFALSTMSYAQEGIFKGWKGSLFAGYNQSSGNTKHTVANLQGELNKQHDIFAYLLKGNISYSSTDGSMDSQKWDTLARMSFDFGKDDLWFNFYQIAAEHDYFSDISYRLTPSLGIGYHLIKEEECIWDADFGLGYRINRYRENKSKNDEVMTALLHTFFKKRVFEKSSFSQELTIYPALESSSGTLIQSESTFSNPLTETLDFQVKYRINHDTKPAADKKKTDTQLILGLKYTF